MATTLVDQAAHARLDYLALRRQRQARVARGRRVQALGLALVIGALIAFVAMA